MGRLALFALLAAGIFVAVSCTSVADHVEAYKPGAVRGSGKALQVTRQVGTFNGLRIIAPLKVTVSSDIPAGQVILDGDDNILALVQTTVNDGVLEIKLSGSVTTKKELTAKLSAEQLDSIHAFGASNVIVQSGQIDSLEVKLTGASTIKIEPKVGTLTGVVTGASTFHANTLEASSVELEISGASTTELKGRTETLKLDLTGASTAKLDLTGESGSVRADGASTVKGVAKLKEPLKVDVSGASTVDVKSN